MIITDMNSVERDIQIGDAVRFEDYDGPNSGKVTGFKGNRLLVGDPLTDSSLDCVIVHRSFIWIEG